MSVSATETETLWSTQPSPTFSRFTLRGPSLQDEPVNDDDLFPSFDAAAQYSDADQASNLASTSASHSAHSMQQQTPQSQPDNGKPLQILTSGLDDHILVTRDDTTIQDEPTHHVDYLTHPWSEEDVWSTWQYVLSKRSTLTAAARLENASWRCWGKCRNGGLTVPAEKIDWLKDYDVLWLYGPLISYTKSQQVEKCGYGRVHESLSASNSTPVSPTNSTSTMTSQSTPVLSNKKSILKKRTASQIILQRSLMTQTLVKHAAGILESRCDSYNEDSRFSRPQWSRQTSDLSFADESCSTSALSMTSSTSSSSDSATTPTASGKRHIKFNNEVAQCIAVDCDSFDNEFSNDQGYGNGYSPARFDKYFSRELDSCILDDEEEPFGDPYIDDDDELSEDTTFFNRSIRGDTEYASSLTNTNTTTPRSSFSSENSNGTNITASTNRTIAMLPPTTLKAPSDETDSEALKRPLSMVSGSSPSSSSSESSGMLQSFYPSWLPKLPLPSLVRSDSTDTIRAVPASPPQPGSQPQFQIKKKLMLDEDDDVEDDETKGPRVGAFRWRTPSSPTSPTEWASPSSSSFSYVDDAHKFNNSNSPISSDMFRPFDAFEDGEEDYIDDRFVGSGASSQNPFAYGDDLDHDNPANYRLVDKVLDTVNTARDIAHVIWNVGWRA
ncbi:hypothetical protein AAP_04968 [Ascosphaera apis ARSEF 7405]|uniref:Nitrogen regulatory protein areA GATA-like domain-containing protein n=1 Tax=Ascosphaera apis ARSEF 7405 TaxID=392613 RepID=A0A167W4P7_9EURO|nr:hypothetical protein AAP_04968 [Ascosphaera apis ARSEF 7405]